MDGSTDNHSDSDSGESWTLLDVSPSYAATPSPCPSPAVSILGSTGELIDGSDRDEDTDGISIISDSESESIATCEQGARDETSVPAQAEETPHLLTENISVTPEPITMTDPDESTRYADFLGNSTTLKTYVHRRNTKVSSALNVIMLGSVITAAGIALGHIWGVRDDCSVQTNPSVNKILSNLYKLQEENAFLRSKLKELTLAGQIQLQKKATAKINKCRKVLDEPLHNTNVVKTSKCMDLETDIPHEKIMFKKTDLPLPPVATDEGLFERAVDEVEFRNDVKKLNQIYKENRNWLDAEVAKRLKYEESLVKLPNLKKLKTPFVDTTQDNLKSKQGDENLIDKRDNTVVPMDLEDANEVSPIIVSYSDSVKYGGIEKNSIDDEILKRERREFKPNYPSKNKHTKRHFKRDELSDDDGIVAKDIRHSPKIHKFERTKNDRQKQFRKQKRENKYEQWQMKGGYLKDYDSISSFDSHDKFKVNYDNNHHSQKWEKENYVDKFSDMESKKDKDISLKGEPNAGFLQSKIATGSSNDAKKIKGNKSTEDSANWFEKRSVLRKQAREMLESDVPINHRNFLKSNSRWYFRRMSDREQLRSRASNSSEYKTLRRQFKNSR